MTNKPKGIVQESTEQLEYLASRYQRRNCEPRIRAQIRMLQIFSNDPTARIPEVAAAIQQPDRTVRRWWSRYREGGIENLIRDVDPSEQRKPDASPSPQHDPMLAPVVTTFLNSLPTTTDTAEWIESVSNALRELLGDVDRVVVAVNVQCDLAHPEDDGEDVFLVEHFKADGRSRRRTEVTSQRPNRPHGEMLIQHAPRHEFPPERYHPPHYFDYNLAETSYTGTIILWREKWRPHISSRSLLLMRTLDPFLTFLLTDCVARRQKTEPATRRFHEVIDAVAQRIDLSQRQGEVLILKALGMSYEEIAACLHIEITTVGKHINQIHQKAGTRSFSELFARFFTPLKDD